MTARLTDRDLARRELVRAFRKLVRLAANNAAYRTINALEPYVLAEFDRQADAGGQFTFDIHAVMRDVVRAKGDAMEHPNGDIVSAVEDVGTPGPSPMG